MLGLQIAHSILYKIDAILFATDYNALSPVAKSRWIKDCYFEESADYTVADGRNVNIPLLNNPERKMKYESWRKKLQHSTTARNRLLSLYMFVRALIHHYHLTCSA